MQVSYQIGEKIKFIDSSNELQFGTIESINPTASDTLVYGVITANEKRVCVKHENVIDEDRKEREDFANMCPDEYFIKEIFKYLNFEDRKSVKDVADLIRISYVRQSNVKK